MDALHDFVLAHFPQSSCEDWLISDASNLCLLLQLIFRGPFISHPTIDDMRQMIINLSPDIEPNLDSIEAYKSYAANACISNSHVLLSMQCAFRENLTNAADKNIYRLMHNDNAIRSHCEQAMIAPTNKWRAECEFVRVLGRWLLLGLLIEIERALVVVGCDRTIFNGDCDGLDSDRDGAR